MYGYNVKNGVFTIIPEEAEIVRRIFRLYLEGMGCERIMKELIEAGVPAPNGGLWSASTILLMLILLLYKTVQYKWILWYNISG